MGMTSISTRDNQYGPAVHSFLRNASGNHRRLPGRGRQEMWEHGNTNIIFRSVPSGVYQIENLLLRRYNGQHAIFILCNDHRLFDVSLDSLKEGCGWDGTIRVQKTTGMATSHTTYTVTGTLLRGKLPVRHESEKRFWKRILE